MSFFISISRPALGSPNYWIGIWVAGTHWKGIQWLLGNLYMMVKWSECEADHLPPSRLSFPHA